MVNKFEELVKEASYVKFNSTNEEHLYWGNAFAGEAGEVCNEIKKEVRDNEDRRERIESEIGDVLFYVAALLDSYDLTINDAITAQTVKLRKMMKSERYKEFDKRRNAEKSLEKEALTNNFVCPECGNNHFHFRANLRGDASFAEYVHCMKCKAWVGQLQFDHTFKPLIA